MARVFDIPPGERALAPPIHEYGLVGDGRSCALVSTDGSLDWLCWPRFDSPSLFGALLDRSRGGRFRIRPLGRACVTRRYVDETNVLETRFAQPNGELVLVDFMPVWSEPTKRRMLVPETELLRRATCARGEVTVEVVFDPRPGYGLERHRCERVRPFGWRLAVGAAMLNLRTSIGLEPARDGSLRGEATLRAGESIDASLTLTLDPAVLPPLGERTRLALDETTRAWAAWSRRTTYDGPYRDEIVRSALALKLLAFAPSGAIVAAPTTSLPEQPGGALNWDYRFCWLRDASLTARALFGLGHPEEAEAFITWTLHATRLSRPRLEVLYDVYGRRPKRERELERWSGYRGARPVRVGNAADRQLQLDVYGEVIDAAAWSARHGGTFDRETARMLEDFGRYVVRHGREPDQSLWEVRGEPRHFTHARVLAWTALDRLLALDRLRLLKLKCRDELRRARHELRVEIESRGFSTRLGSYTQTLDGHTLDAALLLLPQYGFRRASHPRIVGTVRAVRRDLGAGGPLVRRYLGVDEGAFGICSFWLVECLALGASTFDDATRTFESMLGFGNDLGLFAEEVEPATGRALGNFPQAFTHIGLINAALTLEEARRASRAPERRASLPAGDEARA